MIDVEAVCAEWERLGGVWVRDKGGATLYEHLRHTYPSGLAAFVNPGGARTYTDPETSDITRMGDGIVAALPELARAWGVTKAPVVLTWDEAAVLWREWGGTGRGGSVTSPNSLSGGSQYPQVLNSDGGQIWAAEIVVGGAVVGLTADPVSLTHDTLEDMAEACELPRTPGRLERFPVGTLGRIADAMDVSLLPPKADRELVACACGDVWGCGCKALAPRTTETLGQRIARIAMQDVSKPKPRREPKAADQYAEQTKAYDEALDAFMA